MKKAFSLMEIIIATLLLSVVLLSLFKVNGNSLYLLEKSKNSKDNLDSLTILMDTKAYAKRNENIYLDKYLNPKNDEIRRVFKNKKINIKDEILDSDKMSTQSFSIKKTFYKTEYSFEDGMKKTIYRFKIEL